MFGLFKKKKPPAPPAQDAPFWGGGDAGPKGGPKTAAQSQEDTETGDGSPWIAVFASVKDKAEQARILEFGKTLAKEAASSASKGRLGKSGNEFVQIVFDARRTDAAALKSIAEQSFQQLRSKAKPVLAVGDYAGVSFPGTGGENEQLLLQAMGPGAPSASRVRSKGGQASVSRIEGPARAT